MLARQLDAAVAAALAEVGALEDFDEAARHAPPGIGGYDPEDHDHLIAAAQRTRTAAIEIHTKLSEAIRRVAR